MQIQSKAFRNENYAVLSFCEKTKQRVVANIKYKANAWAPKKAKSFTVFKIIYGTLPFAPYNGQFLVKYFTTKKEGRHLVLSEEKNTEAWHLSFA